MSQATADPTLEALVPRGSTWRSVALVAVGLVLLVAAWVVPPVVRPSIGTTPGGSWQEFPDEQQVLQIAGFEPRTWGGTTIRAVEDQPGAHVVQAWATDGDLWDTSTPGVASATPGTDGGSPADAVAALGLTDGDRLPRTVVSDGDATLVVLWQVDDCSALTDAPVGVVVANRWGVQHTDLLRFTPFSLYADGIPSQPPGLCNR